MTTKDSPLIQIMDQARKIAYILKAAERGEKIDATFAAKIEAARNRETFEVGIVMDDKFVKLGLPWTTIKQSSTKELTEYIVKIMREETSH